MKQHNCKKCLDESKWYAKLSKEYADDSKRCLDNSNRCAGFSEEYKNKCQCEGEK